MVTTGEPAVKHKRMSFLEARKIVGTNTGEKSYASVARRADAIKITNRSWRDIDPSEGE